jgi:hypothetical protein
VRLSSSFALSAPVADALAARRAPFGHCDEQVLGDEVSSVDNVSSSETVRRSFDANGSYAQVARPANVPSAFVTTQLINLGLTACSTSCTPPQMFAGSSEEPWPFVGGSPSTPTRESRSRLACPQVRSAVTRSPHAAACR